jgi:hypothetical protein
MQHSEFDFQGSIGDGEKVAWPGTPEERIDRFGIRTALLVLVIALFVAAIWFANRPTFQKCSALENMTSAVMGLVAGGKDFEIVTKMCAKYGLDPRNAS